MGCLILESSNLKNQQIKPRRCIKRCFHAIRNGEVPFSGHHGCYEFMGSLKAIRKLFWGEKKHMWLPAMISVRAQSCEAALERVTVSLSWCDTLSWSLLVLSQMGNWAG